MERFEVVLGSVSRKDACEERQVEALHDLACRAQEGSRAV